MEELSLFHITLHGGNDGKNGQQLLGLMGGEPIYLHARYKDLVSFIYSSTLWKPFQPELLSNSPFLPWPLLCRL